MKFVRDKSHCKHEGYDKATIDTLLETKAESSNVYDKTTVDSLITKSESGFYGKSCFAVVTGTLTMVDGTGTATLDYPADFGNTNSVVIAFGSRNTNYDSGMGYSYGYGVGSVDYTKGSITRNVQLTQSNITVTFTNASSSGNGSGTYEIKIALMRFS